MIFNQNIGRIILSHLASDGQAEKTASEKISSEEAKKISTGLAKVASFPCNEEVYGSVQEIMKVAANCIDSLSETLKSVEERNTGLEKAAEVRCLLDDMIRYGVVDETDVEEKVAELMKKDGKNLEIIKEATKIAQSGKGESLIFEKTANETPDGKTVKRGMFDGVIES